MSILRFSENGDTDTEEIGIGFADWLWPVPNDIKTLYFVLTSLLIIIVLSWRGWYEAFVSENQKGLAGIAIEVVSFSPEAGFFSMFVMSVLVAGGIAMFGKGFFRRGVAVGEERGKELGEERGLSMSAAWYQRKIDAEARGEPFNEPPPWERRNGSASSHYDDNPNS